MSNGFAGASRLDERRRRRLATDGDVATASVRPARSLGTPSSAGQCKRLLHSGPEPETLCCEPFPLSQVIPSAGWRHLVRGVILMGIGASILLCAYAHEVLTGSLTPMMIRGLRLFGVETFRWYGSMMLLLTAQVCWLIGWARSHSINDFKGRYRTWNKAAVAWLLFSICLGIGASHPWVSFTSSLLPSNTWQREFLVRCVPTALAGSWMLLLMLTDMRGCKSSCAMLLMGGGCYLAAGTLMLDVPAINTIPLRDFWGDLLLLCGHLFSVLTVSWHARYVIYTSVDPIVNRRKHNPIRRPHSWLSFLSFERRRAESHAADDSGPDSGTSTDSDTETQPVKKTRIRSKTRESASGISSEVKKLRFRVDANEPLPAEPTVASIVGTPSSSTSKSEDRVQSPGVRTAATPQPASVRATPTEVADPKPTAVVEQRANIRSASPPATQHPLHAVIDRQSPERAHQAVSLPTAAIAATAAQIPTTTQRSESSESDSQFEDDDAGDADQYAGLSRKERKRLRREQRNRI